MYLVKVGSLYVTPQGTLSMSQADALRVNISSPDTVVTGPRFVKLTPHGTAASRALTHDLTTLLADDSPF